MTTTTEGDYILGTGAEELERLGLQHRIWRSIVLDCWQKAGIKEGSKVVDVGSGPGYATIDLAEIVGPRGRVVGVERSPNFNKTAREACALRNLSQVEIHQLDLMTDTIPATGFDAAWCRWVALFVPSPETLVASIAKTLRLGGVAIFHDYVDYDTFQFLPQSKMMEEFVVQVEASWRDTGGDPNVARRIPKLLADNGFVLRSATPRMLVGQPGDYVWRWPASFVDINLDRLQSLGRVDLAWTTAVRKDFAELEAYPATLMLTPLVLEIVAERIDEGNS